ncbi:unnamed protein product [Periconia digitata]|uniref:Uncharacterized protein n=1 Tax=Periconia digitata TaxID=1303443 RepID=A0A9W4UL36_9PLEO|nr:unnamed protein product [Periconia digitata]
MSLPPLPQPGVPLINGFIARKPETFFMQEEKILTFKDDFLVSFASGQEFLKVSRLNRKEISFRTIKGQEVMRIMKQKHSFSGRGSEYRGVRPDGTEAFYLKLERGLIRTGYDLTAYPSPNQRLPMPIEKGVMGKSAAVMLNGQPAVTFKDGSDWKHARSQCHIDVAPGMDIILAIAVNWIRYDKKVEDRKAVAAAT